MTINTFSKKPVAFFIGIAIVYGAYNLIADTSSERQQIMLLENRVQELEALLVQKDQELKSARVFALRSVDRSEKDEKNFIESGNGLKTIEAEHSGGSDIDNLTYDTNQMVKDLSTQDDVNSLTFSDRVNHFLSTNSSQAGIAVVSKALIEMADNRDNLPDYELETIYQKQTNPDIKRITAQVLSMRGDNRLLEKQITEMQSGLNNDNPEQRQKILAALAKTHYAGAANVITPLLQDKNINVQLDALLALRSTGNESHIHFVEDLLNHPDPSISWLANDVVNNLQNLSQRARTRLASNDMVMELPAM
jgi:hypothetical protein